MTCPEGWGEHFSGYCYLPISEEQTWADAQSFCKDNNTAANLVTIMSDYENDFVREMASSMANQVWIGLSDRFSEGDWVWVDGTSSSFHQWNQGNQSISHISIFYEFFNAYLIQITCYLLKSILSYKWNRMYNLDKHIRRKAFNFLVHNYFLTHHATVASNWAKSEQLKSC